jgi:hypothetical protein
MRCTVAQILGSLLLAWAVAYVAGSKFNEHHALLVLALALMWSGYAGIVFTFGKRSKA